MSTNTEEAAAGDKQEKFIFLLQDQTITTVTGETKKLNRCSWGKELQIMDAMKDILSDIVTTGVLKEDGLTNAEATFALLGTIFGRCPVALTKIVSALVEENDEWVKENLDLDSMLGLVIPFLYGKSKQLGAVLSQYGDQLRGAAERILN